MDTIYTSDGMAMEKKVIAGRKIPFLKFFNHQTKAFQESIWGELQDGLWKDYLIDNYLYNESVGDDKPEIWKPVFPHLTPISAGFNWNDEKECVTLDLYQAKKIENVNLHTFFSTAEQFFSKYKGKRIGVHLSGGLDSSLIICLLHYFHIPCVLAGFKSDRFELRTEKHVQQVMSEFGESAFLLDIEETPSFCHLERVPKHQIPCEFFRGNEADKALAQVFHREGVEVVFTGQGGDSLFMEDETNGLATYNIGYEFLMPWAAEFYYRPLGIDLVSPLADNSIIDQISNLRLGMPEDTSKLWVRRFFRDILPRELSEYCYVADFFGLTLDGLEHAKPTVKQLFEESYELTHHKVFSSAETIKMMLADVYSFEIKDYLDYCSRISVAVWLHSLFRDDRDE